MQSDKDESGRFSASEVMSRRSQSFVVSSGAIGKHRMQAELKRLDQEAKLLEYAEKYKEQFENHLKHELQLTSPDWTDKRCLEELEQLEKMDNASAACKEVLSFVESRPDPLLPVTNGPLNPLWDRWFEGLQESKGCRCWIL